MKFKNMFKVFKFKKNRVTKNGLLRKRYYFMRGNLMININLKKGGKLWHLR